MPTLKELLGQGPPKTRVVRCETCKWMAGLDKEDQQAIVDAINSGEWSMTALYRVLAEQGLPVLKSGFERHAHTHQDRFDFSA